ncbi:hypothetical protein MED193_08258 [Roseobacter sp. MED193]|uniref:hypothetical protein n=1 Tax=Roseobacter sp. MED193 TaxID=314262 RepID=UPI000068E0AF|nr:hypothetical protein [Roseobacter sp. MED193]EAQ45631.1 hypothetical protein MED193_08258 [Roseobacter sp. MED193]
MTTNLYTRPIGSKATALGERNRTRWSRVMRNRLFDLVRPMEFMAAEETAITDAVHHQRRASNRYPWQDRPTWVTTRIRTDQMAALDMLQRRHLQTTGKEISKAEVLAALMASGLETIINHEDFGGTNAPLSN